MKKVAGGHGVRCEQAGELLLSVISATFTAHLVLNNLHQALKLLWFPFRVLKVKEKKRTFRKSNKEKSVGC